MDVLGLNPLEAFPVRATALVNGAMTSQQLEEARILVVCWFGCEYHAFAEDDQVIFFICLVCGQATNDCSARDGRLEMSDV